MSRHEHGTDISGNEIITELIRNMEQGLLELRYSCLAPGQYYVHLHPDDFAHLRGILPRIYIEAKRALDEKLEQFNRRRLVDRIGLVKPKAYESATGVWNIEFVEDPDKELGRGEILIRSELVTAGKEALGTGAGTKVLVTRRLVDGTPADLKRPQATIPPQSRAHAVITFQGATGAQTFEIRKDEVLIGRGGPSDPVDLALTFPSVSKLHIRLRRAASGQFTLESLGTYGTTVNKTPVSRGSEVPLPSRARIGLGDDSIVLEFTRLG